MSKGEAFSINFDPFGGDFMIILIDYGVGNLYSVAKAVASVGGDVKISGDVDDLKRAEKIIP